MGFRPLDQLTLPIGALAGRRIVLDPSDPSIRFYTADPAEDAPARIYGEALGGLTALKLESPDLGAGVTTKLEILDTHVQIRVSDVSPASGFFVGTSVVPAFQATRRAPGSSVAALVVVRDDTAGISGFKSGAAAMIAKRSTVTTDFLALVNTTFAATSTVCGFTFVAPPSGRGLLIAKSLVQLDTTANVQRSVISSPWLGFGSTIDAGSAIAIEGSTPPQDALACNWLENAPASTVTNYTQAGADEYLVENLTAGDTYNATLRHRIDNATTASYDVLHQSLRWVPLY